VEPGQRRRVHGTCVHYSTRGQALGHILSNCPTNPVQPAIHQSSISSPTDTMFVLLPSVLPGKHSSRLCDNGRFPTHRIEYGLGLLRDERHGVHMSCTPTNIVIFIWNEEPAITSDRSIVIHQRSALVAPVVCRVAFPLAEM
jgi:hypothetical protein